MFIEYNNIISDRRIYVKKFVIRCRRSASFSGGLDLVLRLIFLKMAERLRFAGLCPTPHQRLCLWTPAGSELLPTVARTLCQLR